MALQVSGYTEKEVVGRNSLEFVHPDDLTTASRGLQELQAGQKNQGYQSRIRTRKGVFLWFEWSGSPLDDDHFVLIGREIDRRRRAEDELARYRLGLEKLVAERTEQLRAANRELETFSYSVSHDLRSRLRALNASSRILREEYASQLDDDAKGHLDRISVSTEQMSATLDALLELSLLNHKALQPEPVDLSAVAWSIVDDLQRSDPGRDVDVNVADGLCVSGDATLIRVALQNVLENAWKFTSARTTARIELGRDAELAAYYVRDNGIGFDSAIASELFLPFKRFHTDAFSGTGIGLATARRAIHRHGGTMWAEGEMGVGATIYFSLVEKAGEKAC